MELQPRSWFYSLRPLVTHPAFIWVNGVTVGLLMSIALYARSVGKSYRFYALFSDPYRGGPFYESLFTNVTEVMWCIALGICLFCFGLMRSFNRRYDWFLLATAGVISMLLLDDLQRISLSLHYGLGLPKGIMYGVYMLAIAAYSYVFRRRILRDTPFPLLLIMVVMFLISAVSDVLSKSNNILPGRFAMFEDGTKLIGIMNLVLYCWLVGQQEVKRLVGRVTR